jgi:hypothetical protein
MKRYNFEPAATHSKTIIINKSEKERVKQEIEKKN